MNRELLYDVKFSDFLAQFESLEQANKILAREHYLVRLDKIELYEPHIEVFSDHIIWYGYTTELNHSDVTAIQIVLEKGEYHKLLMHFI